MCSNGFEGPHSHLPSKHHLLPYPGHHLGREPIYQPVQVFQSSSIFVQIVSLMFPICDRLLGLPSQTDTIFSFSFSFWIALPCIFLYSSISQIITDHPSFTIRSLICHFFWVSQYSLYSIEYHTHTKLKRNALLAYINYLRAYRRSFTQLDILHSQQLDQIMFHMFLSS